MQVSNVQFETQRRTQVRGVARWVAPLGILALMPVVMGTTCPCVDDAECVGGDFCVQGFCVDCRDNADCSAELPVCVDTFCEECGTAADCDDGNPRTTDTCDENNECVRDERTCTGIVCDDGNACTDDFCAGGVCQNPPVDCDDGDPCTDDSCDPRRSESECVFVEIVCSFGRSCDPDTGDCVFGCTSHASCDDGDPCTVDACVGGACSYTFVVCDDGNPCTTDFCDTRTGCRTLAVDCPFGQSCDPVTGDCVEAPCISDTECDDDDLCTTDACLAGMCINPPADCDDGDACTTDSCDSATGNCVNTGNCELATRVLPNCYTPGTSLTVSIEINAPGDAPAAGLDDSPPNGWTVDVSSISDDGAWDTSFEKVKWIFLENLSRTVTYRITPPSGATGNACFDGRVNFFGVASQSTGGDQCIATCP